MLIYIISTFVLLTIMATIFFPIRKSRPIGIFSDSLFIHLAEPFFDHQYFRKKIRITHYINEYECPICHHIITENKKYCPECAKQSRKTAVVAIKKNYQE